MLREAQQVELADKPIKHRVATPKLTQLTTAARLRTVAQPLTRAARAVVLQTVALWVAALQEAQEAKQTLQAAALPAALP
jgi:hypothetical protein